MSKNLCKLVCGLALLSTAITAPAQSTVIFDNLSGTYDGVSPVGNSFDPMFGNQAYVRAQSFMTGTGDLTLESISLLFDDSASTGGFGVHLYDSTGPGNAPGSLLLTLAGNDSPANGLFAYTGAIDLAPNTLYWMEADVPSSFSSSVYGVRATVSAPTIGSGNLLYSDGGADWASADPFNLQMRVTAWLTVVPEPSTLALAGLGALGCMLLRRRLA